MMNNIKNLIKKNKTIIRAYMDLRYLFDMMRYFSVKDCFNFKKYILLRKVQPYTVVSYIRLSNAYELSKLIEKNKIEGAFVECGVWKGACIGVMAYVANKYKPNRKIWLFDSFEGLPEPTQKDGVRAIEFASNRSSGKLSSINQFIATTEDVHKVLFSLLNLDKKNVIIEKGWFQYTLPKAKEKIGNISILRIDADWYESTKCSIENLYDNVISGGYIIIDDYNFWEGCRKAIDEFLENRNINVRLNKIDVGVWFQKP